MSDLERKLSGVRRRLKVFQVFDWCLKTLFFALIITVLIGIGLRIVPNEIDFGLVAAGILGGALLLGIAIALFRRLTLFEAAMRADEKLGLQERLSSAVVLARSPMNDAEIYRALQEDASRHAQAIEPGKDFQYQPPRYTRHMVWPAIALIALFFTPSYDLFGLNKAGQAQDKEETRQIADRDEAEERLEEIANKAKETADENEELANFAKDLERLSKDVALKTKERKEVLAEMSRLNDELKLQERDLARKMQPFKQIGGLQNANQTRDLQRNIKSQNFDAASQMMKDLAQSLQDPSSTSPEKKQELAEELRNLAEQMKDNPQMKESLEKAAEALEQASQAQQQQQQQQQQGGQQQQSQSGSESNNAGSSTQGAQAQPNQQGQQQSGQSSQQGQSQQQMQQAAQNAAAALEQAAQSLQDMQQMQQQMQSLSELQSSMSQAMGNMSNSSGAGKPGGKPGGSQGGSQPGGQQPGGSQPMAQPGGGQGQFSPQGNPNAQSMGSGQFGKGMGGQPPDSGKGDGQFVDSLIPGQKGEGEIIATIEIDAAAPRGTSTAKYEQIYQTYQQKSADSLRSETIPMGYRNAVRDYFQAINPNARDSQN